MERLSFGRLSFGRLSFGRLSFSFALHFFLESGESS
jgi:hypothetical protein